MPTTRSTPHRVCETLHLTALGLWLGSMVMVGIVAAVMFTTTPDLEPTLAPFTGYEGDHARLAAGYIQARVFVIHDVVQFACATLALATMVCLMAFFGLPSRRWSSAARLVPLLAAITGLAFHLLVLAPRMDTNLERYHAEARAGNTDAAEDARAEFDADHPTATRIYSVITASVAFSLVAGLWVATGPALRDPKREDPALLRGKTA